MFARRPDLTESMETSLGLYRIFTTLLQYWACIEYHLFHCAFTEITQSCRSDHCAPTESFCISRALTQRPQCVVNYYLPKRMTGHFNESVAPIRNLRRCYESISENSYKKHLMPTRNNNAMNEKNPKSFTRLTFSMDTLWNILRQMF